MKLLRARGHSEKEVIGVTLLGCVARDAVFTEAMLTTLKASPGMPISGLVVETSRRLGTLTSTSVLGDLLTPDTSSVMAAGVTAARAKQLEQKSMLFGVLSPVSSKIHDNSIWFCILS